MGIDCWFDLTKRARVADGRVLPDWFAIDYHTIVDDGTAIGSIDIPAGWIDDRDVIGHIVDIADVGNVVRVRRRIVFARAQGKPANRCTDADRHTPVTACVPTHERWRIDRAMAIVTGPPTPACADLNPSAVVERRESPRRVVNPSPAPGADIRPRTVPIRCPIGSGEAWRPDATVLTVINPIAVGVQIFVASHLRRNEAIRRVAPVCVVPALVARFRPSIKGRLGRRFDLERRRGSAANDQHSPRLNRDLRAAIVKAGASREYGNARFIPVVGSLNPVAAVVAERYRALRRLDPIRLTLAVAVVVIT